MHPNLSNLIFHNLAKPLLHEEYSDPYMFPKTNSMCIVACWSSDVMLFCVSRSLIFLVDPYIYIYIYMWVLCDMPFGLWPYAIFGVSHIEEISLPLRFYKHELKKWGYHQVTSFYCGGIFSSRPRMYLVTFWFFLLSHIEEFFLPPLAYKFELKREEGEGGGRILWCGTAKKAQRL